MEIIYFSNKTFGMRVATTSNNEDLFYAIDVAKNLGYKNTDGAIRNHVFKEYIIHPSESEGSPILLKEAGLYQLICKSKKKEAIEFQKWVFEEVLASIRKTGEYNISNATKIKHIRDETTRESPDFQIIKFRGEDIHHKLKDPKKVEMGQKGGRATAKKYREMEEENEDLKEKVAVLEAIIDGLVKN